MQSFSNYKQLTISYCKILVVKEKSMFCVLDLSNFSSLASNLVMSLSLQVIGLKSFPIWG